MSGESGRSTTPAVTEKVDLLLRFFQSYFFNAWIAVQYLYQSTQPGVHDYLCSKICELPEDETDAYLLQLVYLAFSKPGGSLERTLVELSSRSFKLALKVYWLLHALCQDNPTNKHVQVLKEQVEKAALYGQWDVPFPNPGLDPLSPWLSPVSSRPAGKSPRSTYKAIPFPKSAAQPHKRWLSRSLKKSPSPRDRNATASKPITSCSDAEITVLGHEAPTTDRQLHRASGESLEDAIVKLQQQTVSTAAGTSLQQPLLVQTAARLADPTGFAETTETERTMTTQPTMPSAHHQLSVALPEARDGDGPASCGMTLSASMQLRHDTFGATLDFIDALCDASSSLTNISQGERQQALRSGLDGINREIEAAAGKDVPIWFPLGARNERVLRITSSEAVLLNSRDKAPFMLFVEVLKTETSSSKQPSAAMQNKSPCRDEDMAPMQPYSCDVDLHSACHLDQTLVQTWAEMAQKAAQTKAEEPKHPDSYGLSSRLTSGTWSSAADTSEVEQLDLSSFNLIGSLSAAGSKWHELETVDLAPSTLSNPSTSTGENNKTADQVPHPDHTLEPARAASFSHPALIPASCKPPRAAHVRAASAVSLPGFPAGPMIIPSRRSSQLDLPDLCCSLKPSLSGIQATAGEGLAATPAVTEPGASSPASASAALDKPSGAWGNCASLSPSLSLSAWSTISAADATCTVDSPAAADCCSAMSTPSAGPGRVLDRVSCPMVQQQQTADWWETICPALPPSSTSSTSRSRASHAAAFAAHASAELGIGGSTSGSLHAAAQSFCFSGNSDYRTAEASSPTPMPATADALAPCPPSYTSGCTGSSQGSSVLMDKADSDRESLQPEVASSSNLASHVSGALVSLQGKVPPLVRLHINVLPCSAPDSSSPGPASAEPYERGLSSIKNMLFKFGLCSKPAEPVPAPAAVPERLVSVQFEIVRAGTDLDMPSSDFQHRCIPTSVAIPDMATNCKVGASLPMDVSGALSILAEDGIKDKLDGEGYVRRSLPAPGDASVLPTAVKQPQPQQQAAKKASFTLRYKRAVLPPKPKHAQSSSKAGRGNKEAAEHRVASLDQQCAQLTRTLNTSQGMDSTQQAGDTVVGSPRRDGDILQPAESCSSRSQPVEVEEQRQQLATSSEALMELKRREACLVYGERWEQRAARVQKESPHGRRPGWGLRCVIVKNGDDCRQEHLALQLVRTFKEIFTECSLPLWVRHYDVLVTSNRTALIEMVPDALSIHTIKQRSPGCSFSDHFFAKFVRGTPECLAAQRNFTESLAAYSIITYLLQIKDRHNGNILVDDEGHLIHIDFGFMLSNSPGGVNFEGAPFKLTRELLEVMDSNSEGRPSELFDYFKVLMIQGFLACRKYPERIVLLVKMMSSSGLPCFKAGAERTIKGLEKRLALSLTEVQIVQMVLSLISESLDAWRTRQYDYYQRIMNGIL